uniref:Uncharacterized protein n=1 Tax=Arundo donax TaxID=35708 RepID=A0A0A9H0V4_ARUDO
MMNQYGIYIFILAGSIQNPFSHFI